MRAVRRRHAPQVWGAHPVQGVRLQVRCLELRGRFSGLDTSNTMLAESRVVQLAEEKQRRPLFVARRRMLLPPTRCTAARRSPRPPLPSSADTTQDSLQEAHKACGAVRGSVTDAGRTGLQQQLAAAVIALLTRCWLMRLQPTDLSSPLFMLQ